MGFIVIIPFIALATWAIIANVRRLRRGGYDRKWWKALAFLAAAGVALGIWFAFFLQYKVANTHLEGFPIPVAIASRQQPDGPWVKSAMPVSVRLGGLVADVLSGLALCLAPMAVAVFFTEHRGQPGPLGGPPAQPQS